MVGVSLATIRNDILAPFVLDLRKFPVPEVFSIQPKGLCNNFLVS